MAEQTTITGRLGQDPRRKATPKGEVVEFTVARTARVQGPDGRWSDGATTWYEVSAWSRLGSNAIASLRKGQPVIVQGVVREHEWTGGDGSPHRVLQLRASAIGHDLNVGTSTFAKAAPGAAVPPSAPSPAAAAPVEQEAPAARWADPAEPSPAGSDDHGWSTLALAEDEEATPF